MTFEFWFQCEAQYNHRDESKGAALVSKYYRLAADRFGRGKINLPAGYSSEGLQC